MACHYLRPWGWIAPVQYVLVESESVVFFSFSRVTIRVHWMVKWAFLKAQRWFFVVSTLPAFGFSNCDKKCI